jgi:hypothetical protein
METRQRVERALERSGRITPREVLEAYRETGARPCTGEWSDGTGGECALLAVAHANGLWATNIGIITACVDVLLERRMSPVYDAWSYRDGFAEGFDGTISRREYQSEAEATGYRDGARARRFVFGGEEHGA